MQLPPPVHGAAVINDSIRKSALINRNFCTYYLNITTASSIRDIGGFSIKKIFSSLNLYLAFILKLVLNKIDLVYLTLSPTGIAFYKDSVYIIIAKIFSKKVIVHLHGKGVRDNYFASSIKFLYKFVYKNTYVIFLSQLLSNDIPEVFLCKKKYILNNGISNDGFVLRSFTSNSKLRIVFLSNLVLEKGILLFLETCYELKKLKVPFEAHIGGAPYDLAEQDLVKYLRENSLEGEVIYCGPIYGKGKSELLREADILIFPTRNEAFPLVLLESLKYGIIPVTTSVGGIRDIVEDGISGFIFDKYDPLESAILIKNLYEDADRRKVISKCGQESFIQRFKFEIFEEDLNKIIKDVIYDK